MKDIYSWHNDLYPLVKKRFDLRYAKRLDLISQSCNVACQDDIDCRSEVDLGKKEQYAPFIGSKEDREEH